MKVQETIITKVLTMKGTKDLECSHHMLCFFCFFELFLLCKYSVYSLYYFFWLYCFRRVRPIIERKNLWTNRRIWMMYEWATAWPATKEKRFLPGKGVLHSTRKPSFPPRSEHLGSLKTLEAAAHIFGSCDACRLLYSMKVFMTLFVVQMSEL